jgi:hypothetical protein
MEFTIFNAFIIGVPSLITAFIVSRDITGLFTPETCSVILLSANFVNVGIPNASIQFAYSFMTIYLVGLIRILHNFKNEYASYTHYGLIFYVTIGLLMSVRDKLASRKKPLSEVTPLNEAQTVITLRPPPMVV